MAAQGSVLRGPKSVVAKTRTVTRLNTTAVNIMNLPKGARILYFLITGTASDAATTATLGVGNTSAANQYFTGFDVKTVATGKGPSFPVLASNSAYGGVPTADTQIWAIYAETGTASTVGTWKVTCVYTTGNITNDDSLQP